MRLECESCHAFVDARFELAGEAVLASCSNCRHVMTSRLIPIIPVGEGLLCPKCGTQRRADATSCPSCGLATERMAAFTQERDGAVPRPVREAWDRANEHWNDTGSHDDLLKVVAANNCYAWAAGRYRSRRDSLAQRQLERLQRAAEATLLASATARADVDGKPYRATRSVLAIMIVAVVVGLLYAVVIRDSPRAPRAVPLPAQPAQLTPGHPVSPSTIK